MKSKTTGALLALVTTLLGADAAAQSADQPTQPAPIASDPDYERRIEEREAQDGWVPYALRHEVSLDTRWWSATEAGSTLSFALRGQVLLAPHFGVAFSVPWAFTVDTILFPDPIAAFGNPTLDAFYAGRAGMATGRAGIGVSLPAASADDVDWYFATLYANTASSFHDAYLFQWGYLPLRAFGDLELHPSRVVTLQLGAAPIVYLPIERESVQVSPGLRLRTDDVEVIAQQHVDLTLLSHAGFGGGLRLQAVEFPTADDDPDTDYAQVSMEPYLAYDDRKHVFGRLGLLMALDEQLGFAFDTYKVATLHLGFGVYWDGSRGAL